MRNESSFTFWPKKTLKNLRFALRNSWLIQCTEQCFEDGEEVEKLSLSFTSERRFKMRADRNLGFSLRSFQLRKLVYKAPMEERVPQLPTACLPFLHFWCWLKQMFRKASLQKGSTDVLDSVVLSKRKRHLNVLTLKEKIASNSNPTEMFWNSKQEMQISSK